MFKSAALRVTLITVMITMTISALFSFTIYHIAEREFQTVEMRQYTRLQKAYPHAKAFPRLIFGDEQDQATQHLFLNLIYLNLVILLVSAGVGALLARETLEPIEKAMELQGQFAADASHELRTPLAAMRSEIEVTLRQKQLTGTEARQQLQSNLEEIAKLEGLASGLLQLAQLESAHRHFEPTPILPAITSAIKDLTKVAKNREVNLVHDGADFMVQGEPGSLALVVRILLDNAIKYGKAGGKVAISTRISSHKGIIEVTDDGPGITEADLPHVFERFWRANAGRSKTQAEGYGLGLAIAREIVLLHKGDIRVQNRDQGVSFIVELPLA